MTAARTRLGIIGTIVLMVATGVSVPAVPAVAAAPSFDHPYRSGVVLVGFRHATPQGERDRALDAAGVVRSEQLTPLAVDARIAYLGAGVGVPQAIAALLRNPGVRYAEPDYLVTSIATSNDTSYTNGSLWGMYGDLTSTVNIYGSQAGEAWAAGATGSRTVYVGDIDTGIDYSHPDLVGNVGNPNEIAGNGIDDDGNGRVDDTYGYDFVNGDANPYDDNGHGTHTAGTIGALGGNGIGVAGVNWYVKVLAGKFLGANGSGSTSGATASVDYFTDLKTRGLNIVATNNSWGGGGYSQSLVDAINRGGNVGILFVAAAGNSSSNNDAVANYPSNYSCTTATRAWDCVLAVASIQSNGGLSSFSSYGATKVDLGAPGSSVISTVPGAGYASYSGTSMATPHVTGAVALCASLGTTSGSALRDAILATTTATTSLAGITVTGGRLNVGDMVATCSGGTLAAHTVGVSVTGTSSGTVSSSPSGISCAVGNIGTCSGSFAGTVSLTATPGTGSAFSGWTNCPAPSGTTCSFSVLSNTSVGAAFAPASYGLSISLSKPVRTSPNVTISVGGSVVQTCTSNCSRNVVYNTTITLTATPVTGARFIGWGGACSSFGTATTCTLTVTSATSVSATFKK